MKRHYWNFLLDTTGKPAADVRIHVFLTEEVTKDEIEESLVSSEDIPIDIPEGAYAYVGLSKTSDPENHDLTKNDSEIYTDSSGYFSFWISDKGKDGSLSKGYYYDQRFTIAFVKEGTSTKCIENVEIFHPYYDADPEDDNSTFNKLVSNKVLNQTTEHPNVTYVEHPHEIYPIDEDADSDDEYEWEEPNRLMSNKKYVELRDRAKENTDNIENLQPRVEDLEEDVETLEVETSQNTEDVSDHEIRISDLRTDVDEISADVFTNTQNISANTEDILENEGRLDRVESIQDDIWNYLIETLGPRSYSNTRDISALSADVMELSADYHEFKENFDDSEEDRLDINNVGTISFNGNDKNLKYNGIVSYEMVIEDINKFDALYYSQILSGYGKSNAIDWDKMPVETMSLEDKDSGEMCKMLHYGNVINMEWNWDIEDNKILYAGYIDGLMTQSFTPSGGSSIKQALGMIKSNIEIKFNPSFFVEEE